MSLTTGPNVQGMRPDLTDGWVIYLRGGPADDNPRARSYWYGPSHGWGRTWGNIDQPEVRVWRTKALAEQARRARFGRLRNTVVIRLTEARTTR